MHVLGMGGDGDNWQIASSRDRQIAVVRGKGGFGLVCAGSVMMGKLSSSR